MHFQNVANTSVKSNKQIVFFNQLLQKMSACTVQTDSKFICYETFINVGGPDTRY